MEDTNNSNAGREIVAGSIGGCAGILAGQPFDTVKARLQSQGFSGMTVRYKSTFHCLFDIVKTEGVRGLYKGMSYPLMGQIFINATVFSVHGSCMRLLQPEGGTNSIVNSFIAGAAAGVVQCFICSPMELIKLKMQVQGIGTELNSPLMESVFRKKSEINGGKERYKGPWDTTKTIYKQDGIRGLGRGYVATVGREGPSFAFYFCSYDITRQFLARVTNSPLDQLGFPYLLLAGGVAGCSAWVSTYPFDMVKTRIQLDTENTYTGVVDCFKKCYSSEGVGVFFKGIASALYRAFVVNAVTLSTVTLVLQYWDSKRKRDLDFYLS